MVLLLRQRPAASGSRPGAADSIDFLQVLDRLAVPLVVEAREVVCGTVPLVEDVGVAATSVGALGLLLAQYRYRDERSWRLSAKAAGAAVLIVAGALLIGRIAPDPRDTIENPPAPLSMVDEAMGGEDGPFFPSSVHVRGGGTVPSSVYMKPESCARSGCHPDVFDQWDSSAHHFSSFNNQWYRKSIEHLQEVNGIT
jgi:hypothetical protein